MRVVIMTHDDVIDVIWYQIRTPGVRISLHTEFESDWTNVGKRTHRKSAITGQPVLNSKNHSTERCGIKLSFCQYKISWGFQIRESRNLHVGPKKNQPVRLIR